MAFAHYPLAVPVETFSSKPNFKSSIFNSSPPLSSSASSSSATTTTTTSSGFSSICSSIKWKVSKLPRIGHMVNANPQDSEATSAVEAFSEFKHLLLPITDRNPYLSEGTRQAASTTAALAKKYGADITVVVIDERLKDSRPEHDTQLSSIRWHLSEGGFQEFKLLERLGEGKPTAIIGEVADEMNLDLVVMSMEAIHSKHVDANLLAEFVPCPVILLPL